MSKEPDPILQRKFEDGIIGLTERFTTRRIGCTSTFGKAVGRVVTGAAINGAYFRDELGDVYANTYDFMIGPSGLAVKTPTLNVVKYIVDAWHPEYLSISKFTTEGLGKWLKTLRPMARTVKKDGIDRVLYPPLIITRNEGTQLFLDKLKALYNIDQDEVYSNIWDGHLEGYLTAGRDLEGNIDLFVSILCTGFGKGLHRATRDFFQTGLW